LALTYPLPRELPSAMAKILRSACSTRSRADSPFLAPHGTRDLAARGHERPQQRALLDDLA
jgi:hypothetical protein